MKSSRILIVIGILICIVPLTAGLIYSILYSIGAIGILKESITIDHWIKVISDSSLWKSMGFSLWISLCTMIISTTLALLLTIYFKSVLNRGWISFIMYLPLALPSMVMAFYIFQLFSNAGIISRFLHFWGIVNTPAGFPNLINDNYGIGIIIAHVLMAFPFLTIILFRYYESEKVNSFLALSSSLGCTYKQSVQRVAIPILLKRSFPTLLLYGMFVFGSYELPLILGSQSVRMISPLIINKLQKFNLMDIPQGYIIAIIYTVIVISITYLILSRRNFSYDLS